MVSVVFLFYLLMKSSAFIWVFIFAIILIAYAKIQRSKKAFQRELEAERFEEERLEQERTRLREVLEQMRPDVTQANKDFDKLITFKNGYFNNNKLRNWETSVNVLYNELCSYSLEILDLN